MATNSYTKQTWEDAPSTNSPISADRLNHMETGIKDNNTGVRALETAVGNVQNLSTSSKEVVGSINEINQHLSDYTTTEETVIGKYNNAPVYRKRYVGANMSITSSTIADATLTTSTVARVFDLKGLIKTQYGWNNNLDDGTHIAKIELTSSGLNVAISNVTATDWNLEVVYIKA